jgi:serine/threonine-protein kinase
MKGQERILGELLDGRYKVVREIGQGAMGTVYEGQHATVGRRLAIKVLAQEYTSKAARKRFFHEARAAGAISHINIVPVLDFGFLSSGQPFIVMDYVSGEPLEQVINCKAPLPLEDAVETACQILSALEVIHGAGLVHRDIKPANIMMARVRRPRVFARLLDFGVARATHAMWNRPNLTRVNEVLGTPAYFSPEQAGGQEVDHRWDLWAVGVILYEMLTGQLPFRLESMSQVISDLINCRLIPLRHRTNTLPEWVYQVLERAHHPSTELRFRSATAFLQALETQQAHVGEEMDLKTVPFVRVDLNTPPPEIVDELDRSQRSYQNQSAPEHLDEPSSSMLESQATNPEMLSPMPSLEGSPEDPTERQAPVFSDPRPEPGVRTSNVEPLPRAVLRPRVRGRVLPWLPIGLSVLFLIAAAVAIYFALAGSTSG